MVMIKMIIMVINIIIMNGVVCWGMTIWRAAAVKLDVGDYPAPMSFNQSLFSIFLTFSFPLFPMMLMVKSMMVTSKAGEGLTATCLKAQCRITTRFVELIQLLSTNVSLQRTHILLHLALM